MQEYISCFPSPVLDDLIERKWLPIIGAGLSRNAVVPGGQVMPLWDGLGRQLANEMENYPYAGPLDAISAYAHEYSRAKLIERISELLFIDSVRPSQVHKAFCSIQFDLVCTTNFDFLLERQYERIPRYCRPIVDEDQLSISPRGPDVLLLKLHGDIHHPQRMVVTEEDYDRFLEAYPLLATYLANLLITRTAVFIGYSLDDPDFRQIWQVVSDRLGRLRRQAYAMVVDAHPTEVARYQRRGVKVIGLPGPRSRYGEILAKTFEELHEYIETNIIPASQVTEEGPLQELSLPRDAISRLCFFAVPFSLQSFYKENVFPLAQEYGFVPMTADGVIAPGDNIMAKINALINRAALVVADIASPFALAEARLAFSRLHPERVLVVTDDRSAIPTDIEGITYIDRPSQLFEEPVEFLEVMRSWFAQMASDMEPQLAEEPQRLLQLREYRASVISAVTLLETVLRRRLGERLVLRHPAISLSEMLLLAQDAKLLDNQTARKIKDWMKIRNVAAHTQQDILPKRAREIVNGVAELVASLSRKP